MYRTKRGLAALILIALAMTNLTAARASDQGSCQNLPAGDASHSNGDLWSGCAFGFAEAIIIDWHTVTAPEPGGYSDTNPAPSYQADLRDLDTGANLTVFAGCLFQPEGTANDAVPGCGVLLTDTYVDYIPRDMPRAGYSAEIRQENWGLRVVLWNVFPHGHAYGVKVRTEYYPDANYYANPEVNTTGEMPINTNTSIHGGGVVEPAPMLNDCDWGHAARHADDYGDSYESSYFVSLADWADQYQSACGHNPVEPPPPANPQPAPPTYPNANEGGTRHPDSNLTCAQVDRTTYRYNDPAYDIDQDSDQDGVGCEAYS